MKIEFKGKRSNWSINPRALRNIKCGEITIANCSGGQSGDNEEEEIANAVLISQSLNMFDMLNDILEQENISQSAHDEIVKLITKATTT
jgi:GMP synthase-like glutamine amidotransferase